MDALENLPRRIQALVRAELMPGERVCFFTLGRSTLLSPDFVVVTSHRVLVLDERQIGSISVSYANIRCNVLFTEIEDVRLVCGLRHRIFRQARLEIQVTRNVHWLENLTLRQAKRVQAHISARIKR